MGGIRSGSCVDTTSNVLHCGACGNACDVGELCAAGACGCDASFHADAAHGVFVSTAGDDTTGSGTAAAPYKTIAKGIASLAGRANVYVAPGTYAETLSLTDTASGISIQGGWLTGSSWTRDCAGDARTKTTLSTGSSIAVTATDVVHTSGIRTMTIRVTDASSAGTNTDGASRIGVLVRGNGSRFSLSAVDVIVGAAGAGGTATTGSSSGGCIGGGYYCGSGANGAMPANGSPATMTGSFGAAGFAPGSGQAGSQGTNAEPGWYGGYGQCANTFSCSAGCGGASTQYNGGVCGGQGQCGCGGGGGFGGSPGRGGGASTAVVVVGNGANVEIEASHLTAGTGGSGSAGGAGGAGRTGDSGIKGYDNGASSYYPQSSGTCSCGPFCTPKTYYYCAYAPVSVSGGAPGGSGGTGGTGSAGGGGAGGPSYAVVTVGSATASVDGTSTLVSSAGGAGAGGAANGGSTSIYHQ